MDTRCELCEQAGGQVVARNERLRVVRVDDPAHPGFYRVIWAAHVAEFSDLSPADRQHCMDGVAVVESALRRHLQPRKINLASLGNMVPHLHWHLIARFEDDPQFPSPIWAPACRAVDPGRVARVRDNLAAVDAEILRNLDRSTPAPAYSP